MWTKMLGKPWDRVITKIKFCCFRLDENCAALAPILSGERLVVLEMVLDLLRSFRALFRSSNRQKGSAYAHQGR
jgi:hypothetical protein